MQILGIVFTIIVVNALILFVHHSLKQADRRAEQAEFRRQMLREQAKLRVRPNHHQESQS
jgi:hypothetical protein